MTRIRYKAFDYGVPLWTPKCSKCPRMASNIKPFYTTPGKGSGDEEENGERKNKKWERIFMLSFDLKNNGRVPVGFKLRVLSSFSCCKSSDGGILWGGSTPIQLYIEGYFKGTVSPLWPLSCAWCCSPWHSRERMERETLQDWSPSVLGSGTVRRNAMQTSHVIWKDIGMACILAKMWCTLHKKRQMKPSEWNYWMETPWRR